MSNAAHNAIRKALGMRPDYMTEALDQVELADKQQNLTLTTEHLTRALVYANLAVAEGLALNRHASTTKPPPVTHAATTPDPSVWQTHNLAGEWAGMEGDES